MFWKIGQENTLSLFIWIIFQFGVGGETKFTKIDKTFRSKKGQSRIFWNLAVGGKEDPRTLHSGTELKEGIKYGLNIWVRNKEYKG